MSSKAGIFHEIGIAENSCPLALGIISFQFVKPAIGHLRVSLAHIQQVEMIEHIVHLLIRRILVGESSQLPFTKRKIVQLIFEDDTAMMQTIHNNKVGSLYLLLGERDILQIVFPFVGVVLCAVGNLFQRVFNGGGLSDGVALFIGPLFYGRGTGHHRLVDALPVVHVLTLSPLLLESLFTLIHGHGIIEIPCGISCSHLRGCLSVLGVIGITHASLL